MSDKVFFDTDVLLYLVGQDANKLQRALELLRTGGIISVQVLNEITHLSRRKLKAEWARTDELIALVRAACEVVPLTEATYDAGRHLAVRYQLQVYDAMIAAAALHSGAKTLYSEDLHDGLLIEGRLKVANPFAQTA